MRSEPARGRPPARGGYRQGASRRALSGEKARRIVEAMRESVTEVGIANSTFERVARKAQVSRGLLHYYFGTKERLLVEVIRHDSESRLATLSEAMRAGKTVDDVIAVLFKAFERIASEHQGYVFMVPELFVAGRHNPEIRRELGALYANARTMLAEILREKERDGVVRLRFDAESVLACLIAFGDGAVIQWLADPTLNVTGVGATGYELARFMLDAP